MKKLKISVTVVMFMLLSNASYSQSKWSVEFRPGINFPTQSLADTELKTGFGYEITFAYCVTTNFSIYTGWGWNTFKASNSFASKDTNFDESGYTFGLQYIYPLNQSKYALLFRGGAVYNHIEIEDHEEGIIADSKHGLGIQFSTGINIDLGNKLNLRPEVRYRILSRDLRIIDTLAETEFKYLAFGLGISKSF